MSSSINKTNNSLLEYIEDCVGDFESDMNREQKAIDNHASRGEFGLAEYCKGREHALALAILRLKRLHAKILEQHKLAPDENKNNG